MTKTKKTLALVLAICMLISMLPLSGVMAKETQNGDGVTFSIPVVNELKNEGETRDNAVAERPMAMSLMNSSSGGGAGGGVSNSQPVSYIDISEIPAQTAEKGSVLVISNFIDYVPQENLFDVLYISDRYESYINIPTIITFAKDGQTQTIIQVKSCITEVELNNEQLATSAKLSIPVPKELDNGTYIVKFDQRGATGKGEDKRGIGSFSLTVTNGTGDVSFAPIPFENNSKIAIKEYSDIDDVTLQSAITIPDGWGGCDVGAVIIGDNNQIYKADGYVNGDGKTVGIRSYSVSDLPGGTYTAYFYTYQHMEVGPYIMGPITVSVSNFWFNKDTFSTKSTELNLRLSWTNSISSLIETLEYNDLPISVTTIIKDKSGNEVAKNIDAPLDYLSMWNANYYFNIMQKMAPGTYDAFVKIKIGSEIVDLGSAPITFADAYIIDSVNIENYSNRLSTQTKNFNVSVSISDLFLDIENMSVSMVDANNNVIAQTVSKGYSNMYSSSTRMIFKMNVVEDISTDAQYNLKITYSGTEEIVNNAGSASIYVSSDPMVIRNELVGTNAVKIFTENILPGTYKAYVNKDGVDEKSYDVVINNQGIGQFTIVGSFDTHERSFQLYDGAEYLTGFWVDIPYEQNKYSAFPNFIAPNTSSITGFKINVPTPIERLVAADVTSVQFMQNNEVVANMANFAVGNGNYYSDGDVVWNISGNVATVSGKSFAKGFTVIKATFKNGYVASFEVPVADATSGVYGSLSIDNSANFNENVGGYWVSRAITANKVNFTLDSTNVTNGSVKLYEWAQQNWTELETKDIASLTKSTSFGYANTYKGAFNAEISNTKAYLIKVLANDANTSSSSFTRYTGKRMDCYSGDNSIITNNSIYDAYFTNMLGISNINGVTFKLKDAQNNVTNLPSTIKYTNGNDYFYANLNFTSVAKGYYTLLAYDGANEIAIGSTKIVEHIGNSTEPRTTGAGWSWVNNKREFTLWGVDLDKVNSAIVKLYKETSYEGNKSFLTYVKDMAIPKPYSANKIIIPNTLLDGLAGGKYTIAYVLDGKPADSQGIFVYTDAPVFNADFSINDGADFTNSKSVELKINANGYTQMKIASSEAELDAVAYEPISATKTFTLTGDDGNKTIYIKFANADESQTTTVSKAITLDATAPEISNIDIGVMAIWQNNEITFTTNKLLRNAFMVLAEDADATDGLKMVFKTLVFSLKSNNAGVYTYAASLYCGQDFASRQSFFAQIVALDRAGNKAETQIKTVNVAQPKNISGTVTLNGSGVGNTWVCLYKGDNYYTSTYTDNSGNYTFNGVVADDYTIKVDKRNYTSSVATVEKSDFSGESVTGKDITLTSVYTQNSTITVNVKDYSNANVADANVYIYAWETDINLSAKTDATGVATFTVPYKDGGTYYSVNVSKNGYSDYKYEIIDSATKTVDFVLPETGTITGVVKKGETPVANVSLNIVGSNYNTWATTNSDGIYSATVYLHNESKQFTVSVNTDANYSGNSSATLDESNTATCDINVKENIKLKGSIKDKSGNKITDFKTLSIYGNGKYSGVTIDENGEFETAAVIGEGTYTVSSYSSNYKEIYQTVTISAEDLNSPIKELNIIAEKLYSPTTFVSGYNTVTANTEIASNGDTVTVMVKFQNDGTKTLNGLNVYATLPEGIALATNGGSISKDVAILKADEKDNLTFSFVIPENYDKPVITIPAFVKIGTTIYPLGAATIEIVTATLEAPKAVKENTAFKVFGEAVKDSTVEILNYDTKEVLGTTKLTSKWYFAEIKGLNADAKLIAKVTKGDKIGYSPIVSVKVEETPIVVNDIKILSNGYFYANNNALGIPTFSASVDGNLIGFDMNVKVKFDNMPVGATVSYSFANKNNVAATIADGYYGAIISKWSGTGTKKIIATVTLSDGTKIDFIVAEVIILIDPSGYITDEETGEPISGVEVLLEQKQNGSWVTWDATPHMQQNPMVSNEVGYYGWDVPEGEYRITVSKQGYETKTIEKYIQSNGTESAITVLPVRTDVNIKMKNLSPLQLSDTVMSIAGGRIKFSFNKPIKPTTLTSENFAISTDSGLAVAGTLVLTENNTVVLFKPTSTMANGEYKVNVKDIEDLANEKIVAEEIVFQKSAEISPLAAPTVEYANDVVTITFVQAIVNTHSVVVEKAGANVNGTLRVNDKVITFIPDTAFTSATTYTVKVLDTTRTAVNNYLSTVKEQNFTTPGGSNPPSGGGGGVATVSTPKASVAAGAIEKGTKVELTCDTKDAKIYYTLDRTTPTDKSTLYSEAIVMEKDTTLKAIAIKSGMSSSSVLTVNYTIKKENEPTKPKFADLTNYAWAEKEINALAEKGIIKGVSETEFAPSNNIKRADYMLLLVRMLGLKADFAGNFSDVVENSYYYQEIGMAKALGLTSGVGDNKFNPEASITRQDMFVLAYRIMQMQKTTLDAASNDDIASFADYNLVADYAKEALASLVKNGLVKGSDNQLNPIGNATRAETAVFIYRLDEILNK